MCQIPLFFTIVAHATHHYKNIASSTKSVTCFIHFMLECFFQHTWGKESDINSKTGRDQLSRIAFEGLTNGNQQLAWKKQFLVENVGENNYKTLLRTGILTEEEDTYMADRVGLTNFFQQQQIKTIFYHKLFCESYGAFYLVDLINSITGNVSTNSASKVSAGSMWDDASALLSSLDLNNVQYLLRFACGLDPNAGCVIINYLVKQALSENLAILCVLEFTGEDKSITRAVKKICSRRLMFNHNDSKILQTAKLRLMEIASSNNVSAYSLNKLQVK